MIYKCPKCNGSLEYNPISDKMECAHCGNAYSVGEISTKQVEENYIDYKIKDLQHNGECKNDVEEKDVFTALDTMECQIYTCTACGAELAVKDTEVATFCAYCGQPTIVFSRVSKELKPESIILFKVTKEQAVKSIRERLRKSHFVPKEIKDFKVENVKGIYIPYWIFDVYYYDLQYWQAKNQDKDEKPRIYSREAECTLKALTVDASDKLDDETSQRLEPFNLREKKPFEIGYLSGFYADKYDLGDHELYDYAFLRAKEIFDEEILKTIPENRIEMTSSLPKRRIESAEYTLLPAWFMTIRYENEPYTMVVNGQTGKIVGTVPFDKKKVNILFWVVALITGIFAFGLGALLTAGNDFTILVLFALTVFVPLILWVAAISRIGQLKKTFELTKAKKTAQYVKERQDRDE